MLEIKTGNSNFKMNLSEELSEYLFTILVSTTSNTVAQMKIYKPENTSEHPTREIEKLVYNAVNSVEGEVACTSKNVIEEAVKEMDIISESLDTKSDYITAHKPIKKEVEEEVEEKPKRLVVTVCPKCGRRHTVYFNGNRIKCLCGHYIDFTDDELIDGSYKCHHCNEGTGKFKVLGQIDSISCVNCKGGIMLDYDTKTGTYKQVY